MAAVRHVHSLARQKALQMLYQLQVTGVDVDSLMQEQRLVAELGVPSDFTWRLLTGLSAKISEVDALIDPSLVNWSVQRLPLVDRCVLRLAVYEMKYIDEVPLSVTINEAVELARVFGGEDDSPRFINGVLGSIAKSFSGADQRSDVDLELDSS